MKDSRKALLFLALIFLPGSILFARVAIRSVPIEHSPVLSFTHGERMLIQARVQIELEWLRFFYRSEGVPEFQVRNLEKRESGAYEYEFDTSELPGLQFEYYLEAKTKAGVEYSPRLGPKEPYVAVGKSLEPLPEVPPEVTSPEEESRKFRLPLALTGSLQAMLKEHQGSEGPQNDMASGNLRVFTNYTRDNLNLGVDANFNYSSKPLAGEKDFDLSNMMVSASKGSHSLKAGDINVNETEFTVSGLGRRGLDYAFNAGKFYLHLFDVSSQQLRGFNGFGLPKSKANVLGGAIGYRFLKDMIFLKAVYLTGQDDPGQGVNVGFPSFVQTRKGSVLSLAEETNLLQNRLIVGGEVAQSRFDENILDEAASRTDLAWKVGGNISSGVLAAGAAYRRIGADFNSVGFPYFTNDREGLEANVGLNAGRLSFTGSYVASSDNVEDDPASETTSDQNGNANLTWSISDRMSMSLGYSLNKQSTSFELGISPFLQDSLTNQLAGALNLNFGQAANLSFQFSNSDLSSKNYPQNESTNLTLNVGAAFRAGEWLNLSPTFGYGKMRNRFTHEEMFNYSSFLSGEIAFWPRVMSVSLTGSYMRAESAVQGNSDNLNAGTNLNLYLDRLIKVGTAIVSLKGNYTTTRMPGFSDSFFTALVQCDFSF
jgi:hypothetical protein